MADGGVLFNKFRTYADRLGALGTAMAEQVAAEGQAKARENLARNRSIRTGNLWRAVSVQSEPDGSASVFVNEDMAPYGKFVEFGTVRARAKPFFFPMIRGLQTRLGIHAHRRLKEWAAGG